MNLSASRTTRPKKHTPRGEPPWDVALLYPMQGEWTEEEFLELEKSGNRLVELVDGVLEVLPMPDLFHQAIAQYLWWRLEEFARASHKGYAFMAPSPIRLWQSHLREPDVIFFKPGRIKDRRVPPDGADLVMEVLSPGRKNRDRDLKTKRRAYAKAKIAEYWIIDPLRQTITVLALASKTYKTHGRFKPGEQATSKLLAGFSVDVAQVFAAGVGQENRP